MGACHVGGRDTRDSSNGVHTRTFKHVRTVTLPSREPHALSSVEVTWRTLPRAVHGVRDAPSAGGTARRSRPLSLGIGVLVWACHFDS